MVLTRQAQLFPTIVQPLLAQALASPLYRLSLHSHPPEDHMTAPLSAPRKALLNKLHTPDLSSAPLRCGRDTSALPEQMMPDSGAAPEAPATCWFLLSTVGLSERPGAAQPIGQARWP